jgi:nucleoside-diphosphate-sugar epimerase
METTKSRVLVVGGTGYIGCRIVRASLTLGHPTLVLMRSEIGLHVDKLQMLGDLGVSTLCSIKIMTQVFFSF